MSKKKKEIIIEDLEIIDAGAEGVSIGRHDNAVVFVPYAVPGDIVDVKAIKKRSYYHSKIIRIKKSSPQRVVPLCRHFGECGGCSWQQMEYAMQLYYKQKQVVDNFIRIGKFSFPKLQTILPSENIYEYRNKIEYTFSTRRWLTDEEITTPGMFDHRSLGFHMQGMFDRVLDIEKCHLHPDIGNQIRNTIRTYAIENNLDFWDAREVKGFLRNMVIRFSSKGDLMLIMVFSSYNQEAEKLMYMIHEHFPEITSLFYVVNDKQNDVITDLPIQLFAGKDFMIENMDNLAFKIHPHAFYQTNSRQALNLYGIVKEFADIKHEDIVYDLYTGTGTIALFVAQQAKKIVGIEYVVAAVENAKENALINNIHNVEFIAGDMAKILTDEFVEQYGRPNIIITDPPRAGMQPQVIEEIMKILPEKIVYVSCNPATQARDIAMMIEKYTVSKVQAVDMFPHTQHVENVVLLQRIN
ncbi:MAG: 23S rRNA (uracil(1939)-C(5))-methyltransferase RlmD [Bacteroidales bacterium]|nr:23S rRNA (uracil(1939)-C(5))-methyltransferase RlmD [Bacteroidales bacterium]